MLFRVKKHEDNNRVSLENGSSTIIATQMSIGGFYYKPKIGELVKAEKQGFEWVITNIKLDKEAEEGDIILFNDNIEIELKNDGEINIENKNNISINVSGNTTITSSQTTINGNLKVIGEIESTVSVKAPLISGGAVQATGGARSTVDLSTLNQEHQQLRLEFDAHVLLYKAHTHEVLSGAGVGGITGAPKG